MISPNHIENYSYSQILLLNVKKYTKKYNLPKLFGGENENKIENHTSILSSDLKEILIIQNPDIENGLNREKN